MRKKTGKEIIVPKIIIITGMIVILLMIRMSTNPPMTINPIIEPQEEEIVLINENTPNLPQFSVDQWGMDTHLSKANASFIGEAFSGTNMADESGYSVAGAGDVNNDGYDDILIGAYPSCNGKIELQGAGQTFLILGRPTVNWQMDLDLSAADASFIGEDRSDMSGYSVAGAGDVNKDGYDDILIGAPGDDDGGNDAGQTYLILGRPTANWQMDLDLSAADASFIGEGMDEFYGDHSGNSVAGAGDVNKDGYDDILIGAKYNNESGTMAGQTYLILGRPTANWQMDLDLSAADASFLGEYSGDHSGNSVAGAGDVNKDGYDDILIGAKGSGMAGQTYLILGRPTANWQMDLDLSAASASFIGEEPGDASGHSVAGAGDVNNDGYDDILIGTPYDDDGGTRAGQTYLILGRPTANWQMDLELSAANASFIGEEPADFSGQSVAGTGDVNNDGYDDILIGAPYEDDGGNMAGQTYLILGRPTANWQMDLDLSAADASFLGEDSDDFSGWSVAGTGDVNNDGYDDILIGAYRNEEGGIGLNSWETAGQTYLILGNIRVDITSPTETIYVQNSVTLAYRISDSTVTIYIDDEANTTALPSGTIISALSDGSHNITIVAIDVIGNIGIATVIFSVDTTPPTVTIDSPTATTYPTDIITVDLSGDAAHYWYYIAGVDGDNQTWTTAVQRSLDDGFYTLHAYGNDSVGNEAHTSVSFTIDTTPPSVTIDSPTATTYPTDTITIDLSGDAIHYWYYIAGVDGDNQTWTTAVQRSLDDGSYTLHAYGNDSVGNEAHTSVSFTIDTTPPSVTIDSPTATTYPTDIITIDLSGDAIHYWYYIAGVDEVNQTWTTAVQRSLDDGSYTLHAYGNDSVGNEAHTSVSFIIDITPPTVTIDSPTAMTYPTDTITVDLSGDAVHYWYYIAGVDGDNQTWTTAVQRSLDDGVYTLHAYGDDSVGNEAHTSVSFIIDTTPPTITIDSPIATTYPTDIITITLSGDAIHYWYYIVGVDGANQTWTSTVQRSLDNGVYTLHAYGNDSVGNEAHTSVTFTIEDTTPPTVTIDSPTVTTYPTNTITITLSGDAIHYWYYIVGVDGANQTWTSAVQRSLDDGVYTLHTYGNDSVGNEAHISVSFTIDTTLPTIDQPDDIIYNEGISPNNITWNPADINPASYTVTRNGTEIDSGSWDGGNITISIEGLTAGNYTFVCTVYDQAGNSISDTVVVSVPRKPAAEFPWPLILLSFAIIGSGLVVVGYIQREALKKGLSVIADKFRPPKEDH